MSRWKELKEKLKCNTPVDSYKEGKKRMVKACQNGKEKLIHYGDSNYPSNYSDEARRNFRARHNCDEEENKLSARYWACKDLWSKNSKKYNKP